MIKMKRTIYTHTRTSKTGYLNIMCESMSIWCSYCTTVLQEVTTEGNQGKDREFLLFLTTAGESTITSKFKNI